MIHREAVVPRLRLFFDRPGWLLTGGFGLAMTSAWASPLSVLWLLGIWLGFRGFGLIGGLLTAMVATASHALSHPANLWTVLGMIFVSGVALWVLESREEQIREDDEEDTTVSVLMDCQSLQALDRTYGEGSANHAVRMLQLAATEETRTSDLVSRMGPWEIIVALDRATPGVMETVMERIQDRFALMLHNAGYECDLTVGAGRPWEFGVD